ncbi:MAG: hypothetical protein JF614_12290 [Acidobacteria bacterium]|nr:hypothetical protein [Acidobacteriota bacterium]
MDAFINLQNGFYNAYSQGLGFPPGSPFQILQPSSPLIPGPKEDQILWSFLNNIPPFSLTQNLIFSNLNNFFNEYSALLSALQGAPNTFQQDLGPAPFAAWQAFLPTVTPTPTPRELPEIFLDWASVHFPSVADIGSSDLSAMVLDPITSAQLEMDAFTGKQPDWSLGFQDLSNLLAASASLQFDFSNNSMNSDISNSWTNGTNSGLFGLWSNSNTTTAQSQLFAANEVVVTVSFAHVLTFAPSPGPWFSSAALADAFNHQSGLPWNSSSTLNWQNMFGPDGSMQRFAANLIVASSMNVQVSSQAMFSTADQQTIQSNSSAGLWPFYITSSGTSSDTNPSFNEQGQMTLAITSAWPVGFDDLVQV